MERAQNLLKDFEESDKEHEKEKNANAGGGSGLSVAQMEEDRLKSDQSPAEAS